MYAHLPRIAPVVVSSLPVSGRISVAFAIPKSTSFVWPLNVTRMFSGVTSRCTRPSGVPSVSQSRCAYSSPAAASIATRSTTDGGTGYPRCAPRRRMRDSEKPSMSSIAM